MKMKPSIIPALLAFGLTACVESTPTLQIGSAAAQGEDCSIDAEGGPGLLRGALDLTFRANSGYPLVLGVRSNLTSLPLEVGEVPLSGDEDLNTIYINRLVLRYSTNTPGLTFKETSASVPIYGTLSEQGDLLLNLLTPKVITDLNDFVPTNGSAEVLIELQLRGQRASGDEVESNEITFPLTVFESGFGCPTGQQAVVSEDECPQTGLNGVYPACEPIPTTP